MGDCAKFEGWELDVARVDEPRVRDIDIAVRAGLARPRVVRRVIEKNLDTLAAFGEVTVCALSAQTSGGRPGREYWLNEAQATSLVSMLKTPLGRQLHITLVKLFVAWRRGQLAATSVASAPIQARIGDDPRAASHVRGLCQIAARITGISIHRIQGQIRKPWGVMSIYRIPLSSLDHTLATLRQLLEATVMRRLPADRRQVEMPWRTN